MRAKSTAVAFAVICGALLAPQASRDADASSPNPRNAKHVSARASQQAAQPVAPATQQVRLAKPTGAKQLRASRGTALAAVSLPEAATRGGISCVPYVRMVTGIQVSGNGGAWWHNAAGMYQRGQRPEVGSVLVFRASGGMRLGHVAVVERMVGSREIRIHHANWEGPGIRKGTVMRNVSVVDVSEANDWTAVRVQSGRDDDAYGRTYPTYGFIHDRPEGGRGPIMVRNGRAMEEVAEAAPTPQLRVINTSLGGLGLER